MTLIAPSCGRAGIAGGAPPTPPKGAIVLPTWLIALLCIFALAVPSGDAAGQSAPDRPIILIDIKGAIGFVTAGRLTKALERAAAQTSPALIVRLDTPGGLLSSTREMIQTILASRVPVVMYVAPNGARAASAGSYLLYASHVAAMAPGTHLGALATCAAGCRVSFDLVPDQRVNGAPGGRQ